LRCALEEAHRKGLIYENPVAKVKSPKVQQKEMKILNDKQVRQLLIAIDGHRLKGLLYIAIATGMRQMELLAL